MRKDIFKKAHKLTKEIIRKGDNYRATFRLCLSFVYSQFKKGVVKMVELKGTEKQIKWAADIRKELVETLELVKELDIKRKTRKNKSFEESSKKVDSAIDFMSNQTDSKFFIDNYKDILKEKGNDKVYLLVDMIQRGSKPGLESCSAIISISAREL